MTSNEQRNRTGRGFTFYGPYPIRFILYEWIESFRILLILSNEPNTDSWEIDAEQNAAAFDQVAGRGVGEG